jgi:hypothetical protein
MPQKRLQVLWHSSSMLHCGSIVEYFGAEKKASSWSGGSRCGLVLQALTTLLCPTTLTLPRNAPAIETYSRRLAHPGEGSRRLTQAAPVRRREGGSRTQRRIRAPGGPPAI